MAVNKVVINNETVIDLTADTVTTTKLALGETAHAADGSLITGSLENKTIDINDVEDTLGGTIRNISAETVSGSVEITANGSYDVTGYAFADVSVSQNTVTGTFTGTEQGAMDINVPYSGNGYPIAIMIYPSEGPYNSETGDFYNLVQQYACASFMAIKRQATIAPTYTGNPAVINGAVYYQYRKNSATSATSYSGTGGDNNNTFLNTDAMSNNSSGIVRIRSPKKISVFIATSSSSYGFAANIEYTYRIIYSS